MNILIDIDTAFFTAPVIKAQGFQRDHPAFSPVPA